MLVATIDLRDSRAIPHTPWPDVQPPPRRVPKPTSSPLTTIRAQLEGISGVGIAKPRTPPVIGARMRPAMNAALQIQSLPPTSRQDARIPLIPAMRPLISVRKVAASPMRAPPIAAEMGVKLAISVRHLLRAGQLENAKT